MIHSMGRRQASILAAVVSVCTVVATVLAHPAGAEPAGPAVPDAGARPPAAAAAARPGGPTPTPTAPAAAPGPAPPPRAAGGPRRAEPGGPAAADRDVRGPGARRAAEEARRRRH